ncbi:MAG: flavin reductase family protein [Anaerostipes sp.]|nr:flavin reductase family protein [Anaerostipes sp.]MDD3746546.1 flavin reductase family protein [Anaerostipes sp.]
MNTKKIELSELSKRIDPVVNMRESWYLVTAEKDGRVNTLTAGWGALGNLCEKKTAIVYIRPQRHTKQFMDASGRFTMTFFEEHQQELLFLGSHSGADMPDKIEQAGLHSTSVDGQPTFEEGKLVLNCKTIYQDALKPENFTDSALAEANFPDKDYSVMYIAEIESAYEILA